MRTKISILAALQSQMHLFFTLFLLTALAGAVHAQVSGVKPELILYRHNGNAMGALPVVFGDTLGTIKFNALTAPGVSRTGASIRSFITGPVSATSLPANLVFRTGASSQLNRMVITENGRVGIGTMTPLYNLHVAGNTHTTGDFYGRIHMDDNQNTDAAPNTYINEAYFELKKRTTLAVPAAVGGGTHGGLLSLSPGGGSKAHQLYFGDDGLWLRAHTASLSAWAPALWHKLLTDENITGTPGRLAKFTAAHSIGDSELFEASGNVGIGTTTPGAKLEVAGTARVTGNLTAVQNVEVDGQLGVGTATPGAKLDVAGTARVSGQTEIGGSLGVGTSAPQTKLHVEGDRIRLSNGAKRIDLRVDGAATDVESSGADLFLRSTGGRNVFVNALAGDGRVGIGTTSLPNTVGGTDISAYKLFVQGGILTEEVRVRTGWADYVFAPDYRRLPLEAVDRFIQENRRLPNAPSANEVAENGLSLGAATVLQQEKIEEIFLHLIDLQKEIKTLQAENAALKTRVEELEQR